MPDWTFNGAINSPVLARWIATALFVVVATCIGLVCGYALERLTRRRVWSVPLDPGQTRTELVGNGIFIATAIGALGLAWQEGWVHFGDDSPARVAGTFAALFVTFQAWFYVMHRALHTRALVRFHRHHHKSRVTTPLSGQSVGVVEALLWMVGYVGLPVVLSRVAPVSFVGVVAYLAFNITGNIMGHANAEVVPPSKTLWWRSTLATVFTYHALHHARWTGHYGYACTWTDRLAGTEWEDWPGLHAQVWEGRPMTSLKERLPSAATPNA